MSYWGFLVRHELFWALVVGVALGAAIADATRRPARAARPRRARERKWARFWLWLALAVAAAAAGMIIPPELVILTPPAAYTATAGLTLAAAALRFPRAAGIPIGVVLVLAAVGGVLLVRTWTPVRDTRVLAELVVLGLEDDRMSVEAEIDPEASGTPDVALVELSSSELIVEAVTAEPARYLFLLGAPRFFRLSEPIAAPPPAMPSWLRELDLISVRDLQAQASTVNLLQRYQLRALADREEPLTLVRIR